MCATFVNTQLAWGTYLQCDASDNICIEKSPSGQGRVIALALTGRFRNCAELAWGLRKSGKFWKEVFYVEVDAGKQPKPRREEWSGELLDCYSDQSSVGLLVRPGPVLSSDPLPGPS